MSESKDIILTTAPIAVVRTVELLSRLEVWHVLSRNEEALSCADAARKRQLRRYTDFGTSLYVGISLWEELKSYLGEFFDVSGNWLPFLAHCRGDRELDMQKIAILLQTDVRRMSAEVAQSLGVEYGIINPFMLEGKILQLFDSELLVDLGGLATMMTNAGEHTWAVRFDVEELSAKLPQANFADIIDAQVLTVDKKRYAPRGKKKIGILTGNPPESGMELVLEIQTQIKQLLGGNYRKYISDPDVSCHSDPGTALSLFLAQYEQPLRETVINGIRGLCKTGAEIIAHPAHSTHYYEPEMVAVAEQHGSRFISMTEITAQKMRDLRVKEVTLLGIESVTNLNSPYSPYREAFAGFTVHTPSAGGWQNIYDNAPHFVKASKSRCRKWMRNLLKDEVPDSCKFVVLGMTEFTPIVAHLREEDKLGKILIDPMNLYAKAIAKAYLGI